MNPDNWPGYNSDEDRRHLKDIEALWKYSEQRLLDGLAQHEQRDLLRSPVKPFDSDAEADAFYADIERFLKEGAA